MSKVKNWVIGIIIAFVFLFFCVYGTKLVYTEPDYNSYCNSSMYMPYKIPVVNCSYNQNIETARQDCFSKEGTPISVYDANGCEKEITCSSCSIDFRKEEEKYSKNLFIISIIFSLAIISFAAFIIKVDSVSSGLMLGSLLFLIYGTIRYWGFMKDWGRFTILSIALAILIYIAYKIAGKEKR